MKNFRMKRLIGVLLCVLLITGTAFAQAQITVSGEAFATIPADCVTISLGVAMEGEDIAAVQADVNGTIAAVMQSLRDLGISENDISTESISIYAYTSDNGRIYSGSECLTVNVREIEMAGSVIDAAFAAGANDLNWVEYRASDIGAARDAAQTDAYADAVHRAQNIAAAAGMHVGEPISIEENWVSSTSAKGYELARDEVAAAGESTQLSASGIKVECSLRVTFELEAVES